MPKPGLARVPTTDSPPAWHRRPSGGPREFGAQLLKILLGKKSPLRPLSVVTHRLTLFLHRWNLLQTDSCPLKAERQKPEETPRSRKWPHQTIEKTTEVNGPSEEKHWKIPGLHVRVHHSNTSHQKPEAEAQSEGRSLCCCDPQLTRYRSEETLTRMRSSPTRTFSPSDRCLEAGWMVHQHASPGRGERELWVATRELGEAHTTVPGTRFPGTPTERGQPRQGGIPCNPPAGLETANLRRQRVGRLPAAPPPWRIRFTAVSRMPAAQDLPPKCNSVL